MSEPDRRPYTFLELMELYNLGGDTRKKLDMNRVITTARLLDAHELRHGDYPKSVEVKALKYELSQANDTKELMFHHLCIMRSALEEIAGSFLPDPTEPQDDSARIARKALETLLADELP
jgi:hypothetical protein